MSSDWFEELKKFNIDGLIREKIDEKRRELKRVNILIAGKSGIGKSTLINVVFGKDVAAVGKGRPVTKEIKWYESPDSVLRLCDTQGLELASYKKTLDSLKSQILKCHESGKIEDRIHIAWLCVSEMSDRIEEGEIELANLCVVNDIPVIVVLTKAISTEEFSEQVEELIPKQKKVIRVLAEPWITKALRIEAFGLDHLVDETEKLLPSSIEGAFIAAQKINFEKKRRRALTIAASSATLAGVGAAAPVPGVSPGSFISINVGMLLGIAFTCGVEMDFGIATSIATAAVTSLGVAFAIRTGLGELVKFIAGPGSVAGAAIEVPTSVMSTYGIGHAFTEYLILFEKQNNRMPGSDELRDGFSKYWKNNPNKQLKPPSDPAV